jgi:hypothetical protein
MVDHGDAWFDPPLLDEPGKVRPVTIAAIANQPLWLQADALISAFDHPALRRHFGLADRGRRLSVHDHGMIEVDQIGGAVSKVRAIPCADVQRAAGSTGEMTFGTAGVPAVGVRPPLS